MATEKVRGLFRRLWADTTGVILPYVAIILVVIVGTSVLALDGARFMSLQSQLQKGADALAIAGAWELDRLPTAITRATNAVNNIVTNKTAPGIAGNVNVTVSQIRFLSSLPASDSTNPIPNSHVTTDPTLARFIEVTVQPINLPTLLPAAFFGGATSATAGASAVAGSDQVSCKTQPMYICNPFETNGMTNEQATQALVDAIASQATRRRLIRMRIDPGDSILPGNYGFLNTPDTNGFNAVRDAIARINAPACYRQSGVDFQPGFAGNSMPPAFNVRFDVWDASMNSHTNDANYAPATNVRRGDVVLKGNWCNAETSPNEDQARGLVDSDYAPGNPLGSATWRFRSEVVGGVTVPGYWDVNHPGIDPPSGSTLTVGPPGEWSNANLPTRYEVYREEIRRLADPGGLNDASPGGEIGRPQCSKQTPPASIDRRIIHGAVINCRYLVSQGVLGGGNNTNVPVASFAKFFLAGKVDGSTGDINTEIVGLAEPGDGSNYPLVQLYR